MNTLQYLRLGRGSAKVKSAKLDQTPEGAAKSFDSTGISQTSFLHGVLSSSCISHSASLDLLARRESSGFLVPLQHLTHHHVIGASSDTRCKYISTGASTRARAYTS